MLAHKHEDVSTSQKHDCCHAGSNSIEVDKPGEDFCQLCINYLPVSLSFVLLTYLMSHASFNQTKDKGSSSSSSSIIKTSGPNGQGTYSFVGLYKLYTSVVYFY